MEKKNGDGAGRPQRQQNAGPGSVVQVVYHIPENGANLQRSLLHEVGFPARLAMGRWNARKQEPVAFADTLTLWSDEELERRFGEYQALEAAGGLPYTFRVVEAARIQEAVTELRDELRREQDWRDEQLQRQAVHVGVG